MFPIVPGSNTNIPLSSLRKMLAMQLVTVIVVCNVYRLKKHRLKPNTGSEFYFILIIKYVEVLL